LVCVLPRVSLGIFLGIGEMKKTILISLVIVLTFTGLATTAPMTGRHAKKVVRGWLKANIRPLGVNLSRKVKNVKTFSDGQGNTIYYVVYLRPSGFVIVSADDLAEPIVAFVSGGIYDSSPDNPLGALVSRDLPGRIAAARALGQASGGSMKKGKSVRNRARFFEARIKAKGKWAQLQDYADMTTKLGMVGISDVWVEPLVESEWGQTFACYGNWYCYNYYTPNHWPCGCVATSMAQLMRFHEYPTVGIGSQSFTIDVNGISQTAWTQQGSDTGGAYNWDLMELKPDLNCGTLTLQQRQEIGALCSDAGISAHMMYYSDGSGAYMNDAKKALKDTFFYTNAIYTSNYPYSIPEAGLNGMINPNLDAEHPVLIGVSLFGTSGGHAIVVDGYGYNSSTLYHHLNLGWDGYDDAWYNLPIIDAHYDYDVVDECIYNVFTSGTGEIISGRVTDLDTGDPISGVTITAQGSGGPYNDITDSKGIYALAKVPSNTSFTVSASKSGWNFSNQNVTTSTSSDYSSTSGNRWGINFEGTWQDIDCNDTEDFETNDFTRYSWSHSGNADWTITPLESYSGAYSARAGAITHLQTSSLEVTLDCLSGDIAFYRKVSSEEDYDWLEFYIDGNMVDLWSGSVNWSQVSYLVAEGEHTFKWTYSKDVGVNGGYDTAWIDDIRFPLPCQSQMSADVSLNYLWMYQNLPGQTNSNLTATVSTADDPLNNSSYSYEWEFILPSDVSIAPTTVTGGGTGEAFWTFAAPGCDELAGLSDSGQAFTVKVTVTGNDHGNTAEAQAEFGIALLGDINNDCVVDVADRSTANAFYRTGSSGAFTLRDCDANCDDVVDVADRSIVNAVYRGRLGQKSVSSPCPLR